MLKTALDLQARLRSILAEAEGPNPSRQALATKLNDLAFEVQGAYDPTTKVSPQDEHIMRAAFEIAQTVMHDEHVTSRTSLMAKNLHSLLYGSGTWSARRRACSELADQMDVEMMWAESYVKKCSERRSTLSAAEKLFHRLESEGL